MSAICGMVWFDGVPVEPERLDRMVEAQAYRGKEVRRIASGSIGFAHLSSGDPARLVPQRPLADAETGWVLAADVRLDDRQALADILRASSHLRVESPSDEDLLLAAYKRWGTACPQHLLGDFAFVVWEPQRQRLFCARDPLGVRQLHYAQAGNLFVFGTTVAAVLAGLPSRPALNEDLLRDQIAGVYDRWASETTFRSIHRLPAAHGMIVTAAQATEERYWRWSDEPASAGSTDEAEVAAEFRSLLNRAVIDRAQGAGSLGLMVSGGLDSSSVASILHDTEASGERFSADIYSLRFDRTSAADEREYLAAIHDKCRRFRARMLPADDLWALREFGSDQGFVLDQPENEVIRALMVAPMRAAASEGHRVVLTGHGGDQVLGGASYYVSENFADVSLRDALRELPHFARIRHRPAWRVLAQAYLRPLLPEHAGRWVPRPGRPLPLCEPAPRLRENPERIWRSRSAESCGRHLTSGSYAAHLLYMDRLAAHTGIELRFPYLDRRVVDFALRLSPRMRFRNGWAKYVLRQAMEGTLPETIRRRIGHAHFGELVDRGFREAERAKLEELISSSRAVALGLVTRERLDAAASRYWADARPSRFQTLLGYCYVEAWLRSLKVAD